MPSTRSQPRAKFINLACETELQDIDLNNLYVTQLRELCVKHKITSTGLRNTDLSASIFDQFGEFPTRDTHDGPHGNRGSTTATSTTFHEFPHPELQHYLHRRPSYTDQVVSVSHHPRINPRGSEWCCTGCDRRHLRLRLRSPSHETNRQMIWPLSPTLSPQSLQGPTTLQ